MLYPAVCLRTIAQHLFRRNPSKRTNDATQYYFALINTLHFLLIHYPQLSISFTSPCVMRNLPRRNAGTTQNESASLPIIPHQIHFLVFTIFFSFQCNHLTTRHHRFLFTRNFCLSNLEFCFLMIISWQLKNT